MTLDVVTREPAVLILGDQDWTIELRSDGCVNLAIAGGRLHCCDISRMADLLLRARQLAGQHFGTSYPG